MSKLRIGRKAVLSGLLQLAVVLGAGAPLAAVAAADATVEICHVPPSDPGAAHVIRVAPAAVAKHLAHGDSEGACAAPPAACFSFTNTVDEDLPGGADNAGWFDNCVDGVTTHIAVTLRDMDGTPVYHATGAKLGIWTFDQLTSTDALSDQAVFENHDRVVVMLENGVDNGDRLRISGRAAADAGFAGDLGNGYVIAIYRTPYAGVYTEGIKLLVAPYRRTYDGFGPGPREFAPWNAGAEISWNGGASNMNTGFSFFGGGSPLVGFLGTFEVEVY